MAFWYHLLNISLPLFFISITMMFVWPSVAWVYLAGGSLVAIFLSILIGGSQAPAQRL